MYRLLCVLGAGLFLVGCSSHSSYQYFATHPHDALSVVKTCRANNELSQTCVNANNALHEVATLQDELGAAPQAFGQKILAAQIELAKLKAAYQAAPANPKAKKAYQDQQALIQRYLTISRISGE